MSRNSVALLAAMVVVAATACDGRGPAVEAKQQSIVFLAVPPPDADQTSIVVSATATSGLPVRYTSLTPLFCSVDASGLVTALRTGLCTVAADQSGNSKFAPAPRVTQDVVFVLTGAMLSFARVPSLGQHDTGTVLAVDSTGGDVRYASSSPLVCSVDAGSGLVTALAPGDCTILASAGERQLGQSFSVGPGGGPTIPRAPEEIDVTAGDTPSTVVVRIGAAMSGGAAITEYSVTSNPPGISATGPASPVTVDCRSSCAGRAFAVTARNALGQGPPSPFVDVVTRYSVVATFYEPDTQPNDSIFVGSFTLDSTTGTVSRLSGRLSESMTGGSTPYPGDTMTWVPLEHQLSSVPVSLDGTAGLLVTVFHLPTTDTLSRSPSFDGTDGWSPGTGMALHHGYPGPNPGNAYVRVFVNLFDPTAAPTAGQIDTLAYADCTPGGLMGATCMTGTTVAGYGTLGSMGGHPVSEVTTKQ